jgi:hypothetical protein
LMYASKQPQDIECNRVLSCYGYSKNAVTKMQFNNFSTSRLLCEL